MPTSPRMPPLPTGWEVPDAEEAARLLHEFNIELPSRHPMFGVDITLVAHDGVDDILLKHLTESDLFSVIHLTWLGREELPNHPTVEFTGTLQQFHDWYEGLLSKASQSHR